MGSGLFHVRQLSLLENINNNRYKLLKLNTQRQQFTNFSNVISKGVNFSSEAISSVGPELYGVALDVMYHANEEAKIDADDKLGAYVDMFEKMSEEQYAQSGYASEAALYRNEDGSINTEAAWAKFYEDAMKAYIDNQITPLIQKKDAEIAEEQARLEAIIQQEEAELESVKSAKDSATRNETIKLVA